MDYSEVVKYRSDEYLLRLTAEESSELVQAALKFIRAKEGMTPRTPEECRTNLIEEIADTLLCIGLLKAKLSISEDEIQAILAYKENRLEKRFKTNDYSS